ncbi:hypothetical protein SAMN05421747_10941 [Parapedobacter composti]|uniref:Uncharacterized protein n=1 Tax=Parapedobacter composti TaxID=623281 RepID=A0A1I1IPD1_9SPHI|nr:DUF6358 family protein [Parapedobacter composti]SFC35080.1 hypothetical protein SAMN05421747_10941 [Parapedobacter composti]
MKRHFLYNTLLNIGLILMTLSAVAAFQSRQYLALVVSMAIIGVLGYLKYRLLKQVRQMTRRK